MTKKFSLVLATAIALNFAASRAVFAAEPTTPPPPTEVVMLDHGLLGSAFAQGRPVLVNTSYKIQAGRRVTAPGQVEIHEHDTDIFYVTEGTATFVTGGQIEGGKPTTQGEIRGEKIVGGTKRTLQKGDVIVVPAGTPHWFTEVSNPFLYLVVKVTK